MPNKKEKIHAHLLKTVRTRINSIVPIPDDAPLSLAGELNLLFLLIRTHGSVGDYITTLKTRRILVGNDLLWADPRRRRSPPFRLISFNRAKLNYDSQTQLNTAKTEDTDLVSENRRRI